MESIRIDTGIRLMINDDPSRVIAFDPKDVAFAERFYALAKDFDGKADEYQQRANAIGEGDVEAGLALIRESCTYMREQIDALFGAGTSQTAFGDSLSLDAIGQFLDGVLPFIQDVRAEKIARYATSNRKARSVLK